VSASSSDYRKEPSWRRAVRRIGKFPFKAVGLNVSKKTEPLDGWQFADLSSSDKELVRAVRLDTMTSLEALCALTNAVRYVVKNQIAGDIVECGVWRGGSMAAVARTLVAEKDPGRHLYLFDTFRGMPAPTERDVNFEGDRAKDFFRRQDGNGAGSDWCLASKGEVEKVMSATRYDQSKIHLIAGRVEETLPAQAPQKISLLRLDTDLYESTRHELIHLFPRLQPGGVIIIDDYGHWQGARVATDEYFTEQGISILLDRVDYSVRLGVKR
jgi:hypothetical protein